MTSESVRDKVIVITGASSGFGKGAAQRFAENGGFLVVAARRGELLQRLVHACEAAGGRAVAVQADVSRADDVERIARTAVERFGRIDVWINNAGVGAVGPFERVPLDDHAQVIRTNLLGMTYGSYLAYQQFLQQRAGTLINVASELGKHTVPYYASYTASKHGVIGLGDSLRQEVSEKHLDAIHICTVMPTAHDTSFFDHAANYTGHEIEAPVARPRQRGRRAGPARGKPEGQQDRRRRWCRKDPREDPDAGRGRNDRRQTDGAHSNEERAAGTRLPGGCPLTDRRRDRSQRRTAPQPIRSKP